MVNEHKPEHELPPEGSLGTDDPLFEEKPELIRPGDLNNFYLHCPGGAYREPDLASTLKWIRIRLDDFLVSNKIPKDIFSVIRLGQTGEEFHQNIDQAVEACG